MNAWLRFIIQTVQIHKIFKKSQNSYNTQLYEYQFPCGFFLCISGWLYWKTIKRVLKIFSFHNFHPFRTESSSVALDGLELAMQSKLASNSEASLLPLGLKTHTITPSLFVNFPSFSPIMYGLVIRNHTAAPKVTMTLMTRSCSLEPSTTRLPPS